MTTRKDLVEALRLRYRSAAFSERIKILDEFVALTRYHRKHAIHVLRGEFSPAIEVRLRNRVYDEAVAQALTVLWEAADRVCGKRLKPLIPMLVDAMERHGHLDLDPVIKTKVLQVSAATVDRVLGAARAHIDGQRKRRNGAGSAIRRSIPVRAIVVFGAGYGWAALARAAWLHRCRLHNWADIDTHGFAILDHLRGCFPHAASFLMDVETLLAHRSHWGEEPEPARHDLSRLTTEEADVYDDLRFDRHQPRLRLEQERVGFGWLSAQLHRGL